MNITFISKLKHITYRHYLGQPKQKIEKSLVKILNKTPMLIDDSQILPPPLVNEIEDK